MSLQFEVRGDVVIFRSLCDLIRFLGDVWTSFFFFFFFKIFFLVFNFW